MFNRIWSQDWILEAGSAPISFFKYFHLAWWLSSCIFRPQNVWTWMPSGVICRWMESVGSSFCELGVIFSKHPSMYCNHLTMNWLSIAFFDQPSECFQASTAWRCSDSSLIRCPQGPCPSRRSVMLRGEAKKKIRRARFGGGWPFRTWPNQVGGSIWLKKFLGKMGVDLWQAFASTLFIIQKTRHPFVLVWTLGKHFFGPIWPGRSRCREKDLENKLAYFEHKLQEFGFPKLLADDLLTDAGEKTDDSATKRSSLRTGLD